jgi:hypothetical protein
MSEKFIAYVHSRGFHSPIFDTLGGSAKQIQSVTKVCYVSHGLSEGVYGSCGNGQVLSIECSYVGDIPQ